MRSQQELGEAREEVRRVAAAARVVAERLRADASPASADSARAELLADDRRPGRSPRSPLIGRWKSASTNGALVEHLTASVGLSPEIAMQYASVLVATGHTTVEDFASLSLEYLQTELGIKPGHTKRIHQHRQQAMAQALLDAHRGPSRASSQQQAGAPSLSALSPTLSDYENHMLAAAQREQGFQKELISLRDDLGAVLGELTRLQVSHAELKARQRESVRLPDEPNPGPEQSPMPAEECRVLHRTGELLFPGREAAACDGDDPNEEKLEAVWLEVDTQREGSLTESDVANVLHRLGMVRNNSAP
eukprot:COSAG02_NODE_1383_length_12965_cov_60.828463_2_plen_306_part_00